MHWYYASSLETQKILEVILCWNKLSHTIDKKPPKTNHNKKDTFNILLKF